MSLIFGVSENSMQNLVKGISGESKLIIPIWKKSQNFENQ